MALLMARCSLCLLFGLVLSVEGLSDNNDTSCPVWYYPSNGTDRCECTSIPEIIECNIYDQRTVMVASGVCVTDYLHEFNPGSYVAAKCSLTYRENNTNRMWSRLTSDPDELELAMCGYYKREGFLCQECIIGYGLPVYSSQKQCVNCSTLSQPVRVVLFLLIEFVPITLFFACLVVFNINITSGPMFGYFLFCQFYYESTIGVHGHIFDYIQMDTRLKMLYYISLTFSELWNLQFFKSLFPPFCLSERITGAHILMLNFIPAVYVNLLFITICVLLELNKRNFKVVYFMWKPFGYILKKCKVRFESNSIIRAFATFLFLSSTIIMYNMFGLLTFSFARYNNGDQFGLYWFTDPSILPYSAKQANYIGLAATPFLLLVLVPALLLGIYPTRIYRKLCGCFSARKRLAVTAFVETLNQGFKDGLNGTRDYRPLAALFVLIIPTFISICEFGDEVAFSVLFLFLCLLVSYLRPCKSFLANLSLSYHFLIMAILIIVFHLWEKDLSSGTGTLELIIIIIPLISHVLVFTWIGHNRLKYGRPVFAKFVNNCRRNDNSYQPIQNLP